MEADLEAAFFWDQAVVEILIFGRITIMKLPLLAGPPPISASGIFSRSVGSGKGQIADWRIRIESTGRSVHVLEYGDRYVGHVDRFDPLRKPLEHVIYDRGLDLVRTKAKNLIRKR